MKVLDLFSGIGGFSLGLERAGMETIAFCEIEPYCQKVLKKHWPDVPIYEDVRNVTAERLRADGIIPDVITGGFPCQDISVAGKQAGIEGERSGLWSECARILGEFRPRYAIFENVTALLSGERGKWFERVLWDISEVGYDAEWHCISASAIGAHHHRDRVWIICYPNNDGKPVSPFNDETSQLSGDVADSDSQRGRIQQELSEWEEASNIINYGEEGFMADTSGQGLPESLQGRVRGDGGKAQPFPRRELKRILAEAGRTRIFEPDLARVVDDVPHRVDRTRALGNAVVPQIPEIIGRAIMEAQ